MTFIIISLILWVKLVLNTIIGYSITLFPVICLVYYLSKWLLPFSLKQSCHTLQDNSSVTVQSNHIYTSSKIFMYSSFIVHRPILCIITWQSIFSHYFSLIFNKINYSSFFFIFKCINKKILPCMHLYSYLA